MSETREKASHVWARDEHDHYAEPRWVSERLFDELKIERGSTILDPACGFGRIPRAAADRGFHALGTDIVARWDKTPDGPFVGRHARPIFELSDFLKKSHTEGAWPVRQTPGWQFPDVIASNPPYKDAERFAALALERSVSIVVLLLPTKWIQGSKRSRWLATTPLHLIMPISPRPSMPPGSVLLAGQAPGGGTVDFSWFVWLKGYQGAPQVRWLHRDRDAEAA